MMFTTGTLPGHECPQRPGDRAKPLLTSIAAVICLLILFGNTGHAKEEQAWHFGDGSSATAWKALNASAFRDSGGLMLVRRSDPFWLVSPPDLGISPELSYIEFRLKAPETYLRGYLIVKTRDNRSWQEEFSLGLPGEFSAYRINIRKGNVTGSPIDSIAFAFGGLDRVVFDSVRIYRPTPAQLLRIYWGELWTVQYADATTVNSVSTPLFGDSSFLKPLYVIALLLALALIALSRPVSGHSVVKYMMLSFVVAGFLFALRMDYTWYIQWRADDSSMGQGSLDERISRVEGTGTYDFALELKKIVPPGAEVRIYAGEFGEKLKYYLLPLKVSERAPYIAVYKDPAVSFDPQRRVLVRNNEVLSNSAKLIRAFGKDGFLYQSTGAVRP